MELGAAGTKIANCIMKICLMFEQSFYKYYRRAIQSCCVTTLILYSICMAAYVICISFYLWYLSLFSLIITNDIDALQTN